MLIVNVCPPGNKSPQVKFTFVIVTFFQIEDLSSQAQIQAAEKFKAPEAVSALTKAGEQETGDADDEDESDDEEVGVVY